MTNHLALVGRIVQLIVSEPWEFESEVGTGTLSARVREVRGADVLLDLDSPVNYAGHAVGSLRATARYQRERATDALANEVVCNFELDGEPGSTTRWPHLIGTLRAR